MKRTSLIPTYSWHYQNLLFCLSILLLFANCSKDDPLTGEPNAETALIQDLAENLNPLSTTAPLSWSDSDLTFLDQVANAKIVGAGEATHGTKEFFQAKHRMFQYLVENHGFKIFAIEADFGESMFINEAIQAGRTEAIKALMSQRMYFWTWHTEEVQALLEWMSEYNKGKPEEEKLQYVGIDCQYNGWNTERMLDFLADNAPDLHQKAINILPSISQLTVNFYRDSTLSFQEVEQYLSNIDALIVAYDAEQATILTTSSEKDFFFHRRLLEVIKQSFETASTVGNTSDAIRTRDGYMADNTAWLLEHFVGEKVFVWAHNYHVSRSGRGPAMGKNLADKLGEDYQVIGFTFSKGTFTAFGGDTSQGLKTHNVNETPKFLSMNYFLDKINEPVFVFNLNELGQNSSNWSSFFASRTNLDYFNMGAIFNGTVYYGPFLRTHYDYIIHFENTNFAVQLER